jgi:phage/plasmid-associated DNA primase
MDFHFEMCQGKELFNRYQNWCKDESISHPYGRKRFYEEIRNMNNVIENRNGGQVNFKILKDSPENLKEINKVKDEIPF